VAVVKDWLVAKGVKMIRHPPYLPDLAPADFFLFPRVKRELAGKNLTQETFKNTWEGVLKTINKDDFAAAFSSWYRRCEKCVDIGGGYVEKS